MRIAWTYIAFALLALASAAAIVNGESAKVELRFAETATAAGAASGALGWLTAAGEPVMPSTP